MATSSLNLLRAGPLLLLALFSPTQLRAQYCFEPFADSSSRGGTTYRVGTLLIHQVNAQGAEWYALTNAPAPPAVGLPCIATGALFYPGLPPARGHCVYIPPAPGVMGRLTLGFAVTKGTVFFSFRLKVLDLSGIDASGTQNNFFAAFGDTIGNQNAALVRGVTKVYSRRAGTGFNLGVARNSNKPGDWVFDSTQRSTNEVLFVVGSYNYAHHTASLWINPPRWSFGSSDAPTATITATRGADLNANGIRAFVLGCRTNAPPGCLVDELRIGTRWAEVTGGPAIIAQPAHQTLHAGATAVFQVGAAGAAPLSFQWQKNDLNLNDNGRVVGAGSDTLSVSNVTPTDAGAYSVQITNGFASIRSEVANLGVVDPFINAEPVSQVLPTGASASFQVKASGTAPLTFQWCKQGVPLADGGHISGVRTASLMLNNISAADAGSYAVRITNARGQQLTSQQAELFLISAQTKARRPNIIFILTDDLGYGDLGVLFQNGRAAGLPREFTPNLDTLAAEGLQLRQHYCPAPICAPSRASLLLGVHQGHANVRDQQFDKMLESNHTLASVLKRAGYATAIIGKWGLAGDNLGGTRPADWPAYPTRRGFDYFFGYVRHGDGHDHYPKEAPYSRKSKECYDGTNNITAELDKCYTADLFTARAKKWIIEQHAADATQPFFLYLAYDTPHAAYEVPTQAYPAGGGLKGGMQWVGRPGHMISTASGTIDSFFHPDYANAAYDEDHNPATPEIPWPEIFKRFATSVRRLDEAVGDLKQLLQDLNIDNNTLVIFTSDNGPTIEDYIRLNPRYVGNFFDNFGPFDGVKRDTWEGGIRMPTFVRWPGTIRPGGINQTPSQFQDWMPTFAQLAGLPAPARSDGVSLVPTLLGGGTQRPSTIYVEYFDIGTATPEYPEFEPSHRGRVRNQMQVVGLGGLQGVRYDIKAQTDDFEIYDVNRDPKQKHNLANNPEFAPLQQQMKDRVLQLRRPDPGAPRPYDHELVPPCGPLAVTNGWLDCAIYEGVWPWVPDTADLTPVASGRVAGFVVSLPSRGTNYVAGFTGFIHVPADGDYTFYLNTDGGGEFRIHDATVIDDDFTRTDGEVAGSIRLRAGLHPVRLIYRHGLGANLLDLEYSGPGIAKQPIPPSELFSACSGFAIRASTPESSASGPAANRSPWLGSTPRGQKN